MSWWDTSGITNLASQALKNAQKKIDKVLDIEEEDRERRRRERASKKKAVEKEGAGDTGSADDQGGDFWSGWMSPSAATTGDREGNQGDEGNPSSWSFPWQAAGDEAKSPSASTPGTPTSTRAGAPDTPTSTRAGTPDTPTSTRAGTPDTPTSITAGTPGTPSKGSRRAGTKSGKQEKSTAKMTLKKEEVDSEGDSSDLPSEEVQDVPVVGDVSPRMGEKEDMISDSSECAREEEKERSEDMVVPGPVPEEKDMGLEKGEVCGEVRFIEEVCEEKEDGSSQCETKSDLEEQRDTVEQGWQDFSMDGSAFEVSETEVSKPDPSLNSEVAEETTPNSDSGAFEDSEDKSDSANNWNDAEFSTVGEDDVDNEVKTVCNEDLPTIKDETEHEDVGEVISSVLHNVEDKLSHLFFGEDKPSDEEESREKEVGEHISVSESGEKEDFICDNVSATTATQDAPVSSPIAEENDSQSDSDHQGPAGSGQGNHSESIPENLPVQQDTLSPKQDSSETLRESSSSSFSELNEESVSEASFISTSSLPQQEKPGSSSEAGEAHRHSHPAEPALTHQAEPAEEKSAEAEAPAASGSDLPPEEQKPAMELSQEYVNISSVSASLDGSQTNAVTAADVLYSSTDLDLANSRTSSDLDLLAGVGAGSTGSSDTSRFDSSLDTVVDRSGCESGGGAVDEGEELPPAEPQHPFSVFDPRPGMEGVEERDGSDQDVGSVDSSDVKDMLEEAMKESSKTEDSGSDNHSSGGEKSESSKIDSEPDKSVYSGHESSDDIETTTSSDIEIIQAPGGSSGEGLKFHTGFDLSPLKIALQKTAGGQGHNRSDSQSSSSASKGAESEHLSPDRGDNTHWRDDADGCHHDLQSVREEDPDNPYHPERLLKKLAEMAEVLQARETKLVDLSKENHQLMEDKSILTSQLRQVEEMRVAETADLTALTDEFTARLSESEKKIQGILKEKESLKQQLASTEKELKKREAKSDVEALLEEKTEQVEELLREGEKLSKQQLQSSTIIKKLRAKEKETEGAINSQKKKLDEQSKELDRLRTVLDSKGDMEKKQSEAISQLNGAVQTQTKELAILKSDMEDAQEKNRGLQSALDSSYKEIAELHRSHASHDSKTQEAALSAETQVREELKATMDREQQRFRQERETFIIQIDDLRLDMTRLEKEHSRREELLRQEIAHLQQRHQEDESRSQELTQSVSSATRPLLRQIENLQATHSAQAMAWERVEKNLTDRLAEAQTNLAMAQEKERSAAESLMEVTAKLTSLEATCARLKQDKAKLSAQLDTERTKLEEVQDVRHSVIAQLESGKQRMSEELNQLKVDKVQLESELNSEKIKVDNERRKATALEEQLRLMERDRPKSRGTPSPSPSMSVSRQESLSGSFYEGQSPGWSWSYHEENDSVAGAMPKGTVYESLRHSGAAIAVENLQAQLKLREGETVQLQAEIGQLERTRESMARELVDLTYKNEELEEDKLAHDKLKKEYEDLNGHYSALLQMYGEKEEQVQELRLDLQDVKEMYKSQIDALLAQ